MEKPLCLTLEETAGIESTYAELASDVSPPVLIVGFNRRFAPQVRKLKELILAVKEPKSFFMTVNAGQIPGDHWTQDPSVDGGGITGEACHLVDLLRFLAGRSITDYRSTYMGSDPLRDNAMLNLSFADSSVGSIHYLARGHKSFPKERLEVFCAGRVLLLDNFRGLRGYGWPGFKKMNIWRQDKGQAARAVAFIDAVKGEKSSPIPPFEKLMEVTRVTTRLAETALDK